MPKARCKSSTPRPGGLGDLNELAAAMEAAQDMLLESEANTQASETTHVSARAKLEASRAPLADADKRVQRLETEAKTISKLVNGETKNLWPPIIDGVNVAKGFEKALGAALGDDLDAPVDPTAPMRWSSLGVIEGDPSLPEGVEALAAHVTAPAGTGAPSGADRRRQPRARRAARLAVEDRPAAGVARRRSLALGRFRSRRPMHRPARRGGWPNAHSLKDIESEIEQARADAVAKRQALETADAVLKAASAAEGAAREAARNAQREANAAREKHAAAEREINRHASRRSALDERRTRLAADRTEAHGAHESAVAVLKRIACQRGERGKARRRADRHGRPPPSRGAGARRSAGARPRGPNWPTAACRRLSPNAANGKSRKENAASQIATVETRIGEVKTERAELENRSRCICRKAQRAHQRNRVCRKRSPHRRRCAGRGRNGDGGY